MYHPFIRVQYIFNQKCDHFLTIDTYPQILRNVSRQNESYWLYKDVHEYKNIVKICIQCDSSNHQSKIITSHFEKHRPHSETLQWKMSKCTLKILYGVKYKDIAMFSISTQEWISNTIVFYLV